MEAPKIAQATVAPEKPFLRADNPLVWIAGILVAGYAYKRYNEKRANPALMFDGQFGKADKSLPNPGACGLGMRIGERASNPMYGDFLLTEKNMKTGPLWNYSLPRGLPRETGGTCLGATPWCRACCYGSAGSYAQHMEAKRDPSLGKVYGVNYRMAKTPDFARRMINTINLLEGHKTHPKVMRVHVLGDFFSIPYIQGWTEVAKAKRNWKFYAYTRMWRFSKFLPALNALRKQPNFNLLASTDPSTGPGPSGWQESGIDVAYRGKGAVCPHYASGRVTTCLACGQCIDKNRPSVILPAHSLTKIGGVIHKDLTAKRIEKYGFNPKKK